MLAKIQKWGNSLGLRLAKNLLADSHLGVGDEVDISVKDGTIIVAPAKRMRGRHNLKDLGRVFLKTTKQANLNGGNL